MRTPIKRITERRSGIERIKVTGAWFVVNRILENQKRFPGYAVKVIKTINEEKRNDYKRRTISNL